MNEIILFKGLIIGLAIAASIGPISIICIQRTLTKGRAIGLFSGLGAATADGFYGAVASFGLTAISTFLLNYKLFISLIGGIFLIYLGIKTFFAPITKKTEQKIINQTNSYLSILLLTLANPMTILLFMAIFAGLGLGNTNGNYFSAIMSTLGVFLGSIIWYFILVEIIYFFSPKISTTTFEWINKSAGLLIGGFGMFAIIKLIV